MTRLVGKHLRSPLQPLPFSPSWARYLNTVAARREYGLFRCHSEHFERTISGRFRNLERDEAIMNRFL